MIEKSLAIMSDDGFYATESRLGGVCLVAMAFSKAGHPESHPRVASAIRACQQACSRTSRVPGDDAVYSIAIAAIFLADLNPRAYRNEINTLMAWLADAQKPHGGWGYYEQQPTGDTSMTQYVILALWTAQKAGIPVDATMVNKVTRWLIRTQDPNGWWGYQGKDPKNYERVSQPASGKRMSMHVAGLGAAYICADMLGITGDVVRSSARELHVLPEAFQPVDQEAPRRRIAVSSDLTGLLGRATADGNYWFDANYRPKASLGYPMYYLYTLERYMTFREHANGTVGQHVEWYNDGVRSLLADQTSTGEWMGRSGNVASTALATLFLLRSTQKSVDRATYGPGLLAGGRGLPKDMANARVRRGKVVGDPVARKATDVLAVLEDPSDPNFELLVDNPGAVMLSSNARRQAGETERFRRVLRTSNQPLARRVAVKALGQHRDLENVPVLIYALTDGDQQVAVGARDALRCISRKLDGVGMTSNPTKQDKIAATRQWKDWYRSIRPDAEFIE